MIHPILKISVITPSLCNYYMAKVKEATLLSIYFYWNEVLSYL